MAKIRSDKELESLDRTNSSSADELYKKVSKHQKSTTIDNKPKFKPVIADYTGEVASFRIQGKNQQDLIKNYNKNIYQIKKIINSTNYSDESQSTKYTTDTTYIPNKIKKIDNNVSSISIRSDYLYNKPTNDSSKINLVHKYGMFPLKNKKEK